MINKFNLVKALRDHAKNVATANNWELVSNPQPANYNPDPNTIFIEEHTLFGPDTPIGIADISNDIQIGVYQININVPRTFSQFSLLQKADIYSEAFKKGTELTHDGQMVRMRDQELKMLFVNETHATAILSIIFTVIN